MSDHKLEAGTGFLRGREPETTVAFSLVGLLLAITLIILFALSFAEAVKSGADAPPPPTEQVAYPDRAHGGVGIGVGLGPNGKIGIGIGVGPVNLIHF